MAGEPDEADPARLSSEDVGEGGHREDGGGAREQAQREREQDEGAAILVAWLDVSTQKVRLGKVRPAATSSAPPPMA